MRNVPAKAKEYLKILQAELKSHGIDDYRVENRGKHLALCFEWRGEEKFLIFPSTPSDSRNGRRNMVSDLRNLLGVVGREKVVGERRLRRRPQHKPGKLKAPELSAAPPVRGMDEQLAELFGKEG
jgi:hypothetical protein